MSNVKNAAKEAAAEEWTYSQVWGQQLTPNITIPTGDVEPETEAV